MQSLVNLPEHALCRKAGRDGTDQCLTSKLVFSQARKNVALVLQTVLRECSYSGFQDTENWQSQS